MMNGLNKLDDPEKLPEMPLLVNSLKKQLNMAVNLSTKDVKDHKLGADAKAKEIEPPK